MSIMANRWLLVCSLTASLLFACGDDGGAGAADAMVGPGADAQVPVVDAAMSDAAIPLPNGPRFIYSLRSETSVYQVLYIGGIDDGAAVTPQLLHPPLGTNQIAAYFVISPDGKWVLYEVRTTDGSIGSAWARGGGATLDYSLYLVDISGPTPSTPTLILGPLTSGIRFAFTADSSHLIYTTDEATAGSDELYARDLTSGTPGEAVKLNGALVAGGSVEWFRLAPTGGRILYSAYQTSTTVENLYAVDVNAIATPVKVNGAMPDGGGIADFGWSPDGGRLFYLADQATLGRREGWTATISGTTPATAERFNQALGASDYVWSAEFTPDSNNILYRADHDTPGAGGVWRVDVSTSVGTPQRLSPINVSTVIDDVSSDSQYVAMRGSGNLWVGNVTSPTGSPPRIDVVGAFAQAGPYFSGDAAILSHRVNFSSGDPFQLWATVPSAPAGSTLISASPSNGLGIVYTEWAPAGRTIAYDFENPAGGRELYMIEFTGTTAGTPVLVSDATASTHRAVAPTWASDSQSITYRWQSPGTGYDVYYVDVSGATPGTPVRLNDALNANETIEFYRRVP